MDIHKFFERAYELAEVPYYRTPDFCGLYSPLPLSYVLNTCEGVFRSALYEQFALSSEPPKHSAQILNFGNKLVEQALGHSSHEIAGLFDRFLHSPHYGVRVQTLRELFDYYRLPVEMGDIHPDEYGSQLELAHSEAHQSDDAQLPFMLNLATDWQPGQAKLNYVGIVQMLIALFEHLRINCVAVHPLLSIDRLLWQVRKMSSYTFRDALQGVAPSDEQFLLALDHTIELAQVLSGNDSFHISLAVELYPDRWWIFDPYKLLLVEVPSEFQFANKVRLMREWQDKAPGIEIEVGSNIYHSGLLHKLDKIVLEAIEISAAGASRGGECVDYRRLSTAPISAPYV